VNVRRHAAVLAAAGLTACGGTAVGIVASVRPPSPQHATLSLARAPYGVWLRNANDIALVSTTGTVERALPAGVLTRDWSRLYAVTGPVSPALRVIDPRTGRELRRMPLPGVYQVPSAGISGVPEGLSPNGRWLVLQTPYPSSERTASDLLALDTRGVVAARRIHLAGDFTYDGIDNAGNNLYLIERTSLFNTTPDRYRVRRYDLRSRRLDPQVVVDKSEPGEAMTGTALSRVASPDGAWQFTIYVFGNRGPFVHALNLATANAFCIDLPAPAISDSPTQLLWSLAQSNDGSSVYAINGGSGQVLQIATGRFPRVVRTAQLSIATATPAALSRGPVITAEAKLVVSSGAWLSPDGATLYAVTGDGVISVDTAELSVRSHLLEGETVRSLALSPNGRWLAALTQRGAVIELDTTNGAAAAISAPADPLAILRFAG